MSEDGRTQLTELFNTSVVGFDRVSNSKLIGNQCPVQSLNLSMWDFIFSTAIVIGASSGGYWAIYVCIVNLTKNLAITKGRSNGKECYQSNII